ncbi:MAG: protein kinase [Polyangiaceae bacterium]|nr:protein kinase [Polyangiaceae bacterium]
MDSDLLRVELEKHFELDELQELGRDVLGLEPEQVVATSTKAAFARALVTRCASAMALEALCDAMVNAREDVDDRFRNRGTLGFPTTTEPAEGDAFGPFRIDQRLGEGRLGVVFRARDASGEVRLKLLRPEATSDLRALNRFLTQNRLLARVSRAGLPGWLTVGEVEGRYFVVHELTEGETLAEWITRTGPIPLGDARPMLDAILEALAELHAHRLVHGALHAGNVLLVSPNSGLRNVVLLDAGSDRLRLGSPVTLPQHDRLSTIAPAAFVAPEQILGGPVDARTDLYAFGALVYQVITGAAPFAEGSIAQTILGHITREPPSLARMAPHGWVSDQLDDLVRSLLVKDPKKRPSDTLDVLSTLDAAPARAPLAENLISPEVLDERLNDFFQYPDEDATARLEATIDDGAPPTRIAEALAMASDQLAYSNDPHAFAHRRRLMLRAIRLYEITARDLGAAEALARGLLESDQRDPEVNTILSRLLRAQGKHEELVEMLLNRSQEVAAGSERAEVLAEIGKIYAKDLEDPAQALVAYVSAYCEDPTKTALARETERLAGSSQEAWSEVLGTCIGALEGLTDSRRKRALWVQLGRWYADKVARPDLAVQMFEATIAEDPGNTDALEALAKLYRMAQQWVELGTVLTAHADVCTNPARARDLRTEAGDILLYQLNEPTHARGLYERVLAEDPSHENAAKSLATVFEQSGDARHYAETLEQRAAALSGEERHKALCNAGRAYEEQLDDLESAAKRYEDVLAEDPQHPEALKGLDRCCVRLHRHSRLLEVLNLELELARTPRDRVTILERIGDLHEAEFLDHLQAIEARETILELEPTNDNALAGLGRDLRALKRWRDLVVVYERHMDVLTDRHRRVALGLQMGELFGTHLKVPERAIESYESVLRIEPANETALDALIQLWAEQGEVHRALESVDTLVAEATTPTERAAQQLRAAKLLEAAGDGDGAIERYKAACDASPDDKALLAALRQAYVRRRRFQVAVELMERELELADGAAAKGTICGEMARVLLDGLHEDLRAETVARRALENDPGNLTAIVVLGDIALANDQFLTASKHYERALAGKAAFDRDESIRIHLCCMDAMLHSDQALRALEIGESVREMAPDDLDVALRVADLTYSQGDALDAYERYRDILNRFDADLTEEARFTATYRIGDSARKFRQHEEADRWLNAAAELDPNSPLPFRGLVELRLTEGHPEAAYEAMNMLLDLEAGDDHVELLIKMGDLAGSALRDTNRASRHYLLALSERRDDRKILAKLMQLYSEEKDWRKLTKVILKISELVEDPRQKAKYLHTAAMIASREMNDPTQAAELLQQALEQDPTFEDARTEALKQARKNGSYEALKTLLKDRIRFAVESGDHPTALAAMDELGTIYLDQFGRRDQAVAIAESALGLVPDDLDRRARLAALYAGDPGQYFDQALNTYSDLLERAPLNAETYRALRHLFTEVKWGDATWCCCQALTALGQATPDEQQFYLRMRAKGPTVAQTRLDDEVWAASVTHPDTAHLLTLLFTVIQPSVATVCARPATDLGYVDEHRVDPDRDGYLVAQSLHYAAEVLGIEQPPLYQNSNDPGLVSFLHATTPSLVLGRAALGQRTLDQRTAFTTGRLVTYFRPGFYVRHLIPTGTELKAWLFATLALVSPKIRVPADLESIARAPLQALEVGLADESRRYLAKEVVPRLLEGGALDLKRWVTAVDLTADRVGLLMANDLQVAITELRGAPDASVTLTANDRIEHLLRYSVSSQFIALRRHIGSAVDL